MNRNVLVWLGLATMVVAAMAQTGTVPLDSGTPPSGMTNSNITEVNGNVGIGTTSPGNPLSVNGAVNAGGNYYNVLSYNLNGTPANGVKIKTTLPFADWSQMSTIIIEGYNYGSAQTIGLTISYYIYNGAFYSYTASSSGGYTPQIQLSNEGGYVVVFLNDKPYFQRFTVRAFAQGISETASWFNGWSVVDQP